MTRIPFFLSIVVTATITASFAHAGTDYRCTIERIYDADGDKSPLIDGQRKRFVGKEFTVDRRLGVMIGALKNSYMTEPVVVDRGSKDNSFKVVTTMRRDQGVGDGSSVFTLVVKEYLDTPIEYAVDGMGTGEDVEKRHRLVERMNETLGWTGLGACDGGSIGSGTMDVCNFVVDFETAKAVIAKDLEGTEFANFTRIYGENA